MHKTSYASIRFWINQKMFRDAEDSLSTARSILHLTDCTWSRQTIQHHGNNKNVTLFACIFRITIHKAVINAPASQALYHRRVSLVYPSNNQIYPNIDSFTATEARIFSPQLFWTFLAHSEYRYRIFNNSTLKISSFPHPTPLVKPICPGENGSLSLATHNPQYRPYPYYGEHPTHVASETGTLLIYYQRSWQLFKCK